MDQIISSFGIDAQLFAAEVVNFLVVLFILYYFVFRKISTMLDERKGVIESGIENAQKAEERLEEAESEKHKILQDAGEQATAEIKAAVETAKMRESDIMVEAQTKADDLIENANKKGEEMKENIIASSKEDIAKMVVLGAEKVLAGK